MERNWRPRLRGKLYVQCTFSCLCVPRQDLFGRLAREPRDECEEWKEANTMQQKNIVQQCKKAKVRFVTLSHMHQKENEMIQDSFSWAITEQEKERDR